MSNYRRPGTTFTIREIVMDPNKRKKTAENELTMLFCDILLERRISLEEWEILMERYWKRRYPNDPIRAAQEKTNAARALTSNRLTWMRFDEVIQCLGADSYEYSVTLHYADKPSSTHTLKIRNRHREEPTHETVTYGDEDDEEDLSPMGGTDPVDVVDEDCEKREYSIRMKFASFDPQTYSAVVDTKKDDGNDE